MDLHGLVPARPHLAELAQGQTSVLCDHLILQTDRTHRYGRQEEEDSYFKTSKGYKWFEDGNNVEMTKEVDTRRYNCSGPRYLRRNRRQLFKGRISFLVIPDLKLEPTQSKCMPRFTRKWILPYAPAWRLDLWRRRISLSRRSSAEHGARAESLR